MNGQPAPNPYQQPYQVPYQQPVVTTAGGWFGWIVLCSFLPLIGLIIMLCTTKDPSAKNYAKCMLIYSAIIFVVFLIFGAVLVPAIIGYLSKMS